MDDPEDSKEGTAAENKFIQQVIGTFLYLGRAVDGTHRAPLSAIASKQSSRTEDTLSRTKHYGLYNQGTPTQYGTHNN